MNAQSSLRLLQLVSPTYSPEISRNNTCQCLGLLAFKSVKQGYQPTPEIRRFLEIFRRMVNDCVEIGLSCNVTALRRLSLLSWPRRREYECPSYYKVCAVSRAAGILATRKKSLRRGKYTKSPYSIRPQITAYRGFRIENGDLRVPVGKGRFEYLPLTRHSISTLSDPGVRVRSFTLTSTSLSLCVSKEAPDFEFTQTIGVDRNLRNLTVGNEDRIVQYNLSETIRIAKTSVRIGARSSAMTLEFEERLLQSMVGEDETE